MPRKTLALITGLVLITFFLFVIALNRANNSTQNQSIPLNGDKQNISNDQEMIGPTSDISMQQHTVLTISPNPTLVAVGEQGSVDVNIDTAGNEVTAIQLEIGYDPNFITDVRVVPGDLFTNPVVLIDKNILEQGRHTYAYGIMPNHSPIVGIGNVARITFTALNNPTATQLALLPTTLVTARGISNSVLKSATEALINIESASSSE